MKGNLNTAYGLYRKLYTIEGKMVDTIDKLDICDGREM